MLHLKIIIEKSKDHFSAYAENLEGIYGGGNSIEEVKKSILESIKLFKEFNTDIPKELKGNFKLVFDTQSFLE